MNASSILKTSVAFAAGLAVVAFAYFALVRPFWEASRSDTPVMRSYPVTGDHADEVRAALQSALRGADDKRVLGRVTLAPNGQLIVTAPPSIQRGVDALLNDVLASSSGPTPTIRLEAWFVRGTSEPGAADARLAEVEPALAAIREAQGTTRFELIEKLTLHSRAGHGGLVEGVRASLHGEPTVRRVQKDMSVVSAQLQLRVPPMGGSLAADVELTAGELLVLGQSAYAEGDPATAPPQTLYYIVRATL
jgi:hypothetical protein